MAPPFSRRDPLDETRPLQRARVRERDDEEIVEDDERRRGLRSFEQRGLDERRVHRGDARRREQETRRRRVHADIRQPVDPRQVFARHDDELVTRDAHEPRERAVIETGESFRQPSRRRSSRDGGRGRERRLTERP